MNSLAFTKTLTGIGFAAIFGFAGNVNAAVTLVGNYGLGEAGTVGSAPHYLIDSAGVANDFDYFQPGPNYTVLTTTTGLAAPGSTAAIGISSGSDRNSGWIVSAANAYGFADDWAVQLWAITPDATTASNSFVLFNTDMNTPSSSISLEFSGNSVNLMQDTNTGTRVAGFNYTAGQWFRATLISYNGQVSLYQGNSLVTSTTGLAHNLDSLGLAIGPGALSGRGSNASFDEMRVWSFNHATDSLSSVLSAASVTTVPEPSSLALFALGAVGVGALGRKRRA